MATLQESAQSILNEKNLKVLPENIVAGVTMFGVEGIAEIGEGVKVFKTVEELQADSNATFGDTAVVYDEETGAFGGYYTCILDPNAIYKACLSGQTTFTNEVRVNHNIAGLPETFKTVDYSGSFVVLFDKSENKYIGHANNYSTFIYYASNGEKYLAYCCPSDDDIPLWYVEVGADRNTILMKEKRTSSAYSTITSSGMFGMPCFKVAQISDEDIIMAVQGGNLRPIVETYNESNGEMGGYTPQVDATGEVLPYELLADAGLDTSDATATSYDIVAGATAYINGEKVTGTIENYYAADFDAKAVWSTTLEDGVTPAIGFALNELEQPIAFQKDGGIGLRASEASIAELAGVTADKIVSGYSILGIEGTAEMGEGLTAISSVDELANLTNTSEKVALISPEKLEKIVDKMGPSIFIRKEFTMEEALPNGYKFAYFYTASGEWEMSSWGSYIDFDLRDSNTGDTLKSYHWNRQADGLTYSRSGSDEIVFLGGSYNAGSSSYPEILRITSTAFANYSAAENKIYEYNGTEWVLAEGQIDTTDATAQARDIVKGKTAYINGEKVTGSVKVGDDYLRLDVREIWQNGDLTHIFFDQDRFESDVLYRNGTHIESNLSTSQVASDLGITADKIVKGQTILDIEGTVDIGGGVDTSDATATAADMLEGVDAYIQGEKVTGTMANLSGKNISGAMNDITVSNNNVQMTILPGNFGYVDDLTHVNVSMGEVELANELGIDANKIMKGETVLGIEGTREAGAGDTPIIASTDELATITDTTTKVILVAPEKIETITSIVGPHILVKKQFTLDTAITSNTWGYSNISSGEQLYLEINASQMKLSTDSFSYTWYVQSDGLTYSRSGEDEVVYLRGTGNMSSFYGNSKKAFNASVFNYSAETTVIYEHNGSDWVPMRGQTDTSDATAKASDMLWGKTAYVNGKKVTGTINGASSMTYNSYPKIYGGRIQMTASVGNYYFYSGGTLTCETTFANMANVIGLTAAKIKKGETILGIEGTYEGE